MGVPNWSTQVVEKVVEVPHVLMEEVPVEVPQIQTAEVVRQDAVAQTREVVKQIPRVSMQYRERVVELREQIQNQVISQPIVETIAPVPIVENLAPVTTIPATTAFPSVRALPTATVGGTYGTALPTTTIGTGMIGTYGGYRSGVGVPGSYRASTI